jgi:hypothetical protein
VQADRAGWAHHQDQHVPQQLRRELAVLMAPPQHLLHGQEGIHVRLVGEQRGDEPAGKGEKGVHGSVGGRGEPHFKS